MKCEACGVEVDRRDERFGAHPDPGVLCPSCGRPMRASYSYRKLVIFGIIVAAVIAYLYLKSPSVSRHIEAEFDELRATDPGPAKFDGTFPCVHEDLAKGEAPTLGKCAMPTAYGGPVDVFEADLRFGRFVLRQSDLYVNDVFEVPFTRSYVSWEFYRLKDLAFGRLTNHPYDIAPFGTRHPYTEMDLVLDDGDFLHFDRISNGEGYGDAFYRHSETGTQYYRSTMEWNGDGWTLKRVDGSQVIFPEAYNAKNAAQGAAIEFRDRDGNRLKLIRDSERKLEEITTPHGKWIKLKYDAANRISRAEDSAGNWTSYTYDAEGLVQDVVHSSGRERHYKYRNWQMTEVADEGGKVLIKNSYANEHLARQEFANGSIYTYEYGGLWNGYFATKVTVTGPDGVVTTIAVSGSVPQKIKAYAR